MELLNSRVSTGSRLQEISKDLGALCNSTDSRFQKVIDNVVSQATESDLERGCERG
jgi:hypothetical protein